MDKLQLTGQNLGRVFNFRSGHLHAATFLVLSLKLPNLQLKTRPKQVLGSLPLVIVIPSGTFIESPVVASSVVWLSQTCSSYLIKHFPASLQHTAFLPPA
jgi:hypothetical protein